MNNQLHISSPLNYLGDINWGLIGGSVAGIVFVLIILGLAGRFLKFKRTNDSKKG